MLTKLLLRSLLIINKIDTVIVLKILFLAQNIFSCSHFCKLVERFSVDRLEVPKNFI